MLGGLVRLGIDPFHQVSKRVLSIVEPPASVLLPHEYVGIELTNCVGKYDLTVGPLSLRF